jgi:hypothetical protein
MYADLGDLSQEQPSSWQSPTRRQQQHTVRAPVLGLLQTTGRVGSDSGVAGGGRAATGGRVVVFGDSACLESTQPAWPKHAYCSSLVRRDIRSLITRTHADTEYLVASCRSCLKTYRVLVSCPTDTMGTILPPTSKAGSSTCTAIFLMMRDRSCHCATGDGMSLVQHHNASIFLCLAGGRLDALRRDRRTVPNAGGGHQARNYYYRYLGVELAAGPPGPAGPAACRRRVTVDHGDNQ